MCFLCVLSAIMCSEVDDETIPIIWVKNSMHAPDFLWLAAAFVRMEVAL